MLDIELKEIQSDVRLDKILSLWHCHKKLIVGALLSTIVLVIVGLIVSYHRTTTREKAADILFELIQSPEDNERYDILFKTLSPYPFLGTLAHHPDVKMLEKMYENVRQDPTLREALILFVALRYLEDATFPQSIETDLKTLSSSASTWAPLARELLAFLAFKRDEPNVKKLFQELTQDEQATPGIKQRAKAMLEKIS